MAAKMLIQITLITIVGNHRLFGMKGASGESNFKGTYTFTKTVSLQYSVRNFSPEIPNTQSASPVMPLDTPDSVSPTDVCKILESVLILPTCGHLEILFLPLR